MALPSGYTICNMLGGANCYFETGVNPSSTLVIDGLFFSTIPEGSYSAYLFGARNQSSTSSSGQLNLLYSNSAGYGYLGYQSARVQFAFTNGYTQIKNKANVFDLYNTVSNVRELTGNSTAFSGNQPMYLLALNNAGSVSYGTSAEDCTVAVCEFSISENGAELKHYIPCYNGSQFGLYELVGGSFITKQGTGSLRTMYLLQTDSSVGGEAYIMTDTQGYVKQKYIYNRSNVLPERLVAVAKEGYEFLNWTVNGTVVSNEEYYEYRESSTSVVSANTTVKANFIKKTDIDYKSGYQLLAIQYGVGKFGASSPNGNLSDFYSDVLSYSINTDILSKTTSTIELKEMPSTYQVNMPVFLFSPKGKIIYTGIITAINDKTLTCREPISIFDYDIVFAPLLSADRYYSTYYGLYAYVGVSLLGGYGSTDRLNTPSNPAIEKKTTVLMDNFVKGQKIYDDRIIFGDTIYNIPNYQDNNVSNAEDYLLKMTEEYGVVYESSLYDYTSSTYPAKGIKHLLLIRFVNPSKYGVFTMGTNSDAISNVNIVVEANNANTLMIFDNAGTTLRGQYGVKKDGSVESIATMTSDFLAYDNCISKVIKSDDDIKGLVRENLGNAMLNHRITFDVDLNSPLYRFEDFKLGRKVNFYDGDKLYVSMVTAVNFTDLNKLSVTLGNVRIKLTTKLNLGKVKK